MVKPTTCLMCGKTLKKYTRFWWEKLDDPGREPLLGAYLKGQGVVREIVRVKGDAGERRVTYWTGEVGYNGRGYFCSVRCGYLWAMDEVEQQMRIS
jgi:hypothetical protein